MIRTALCTAVLAASGLFAMNAGALFGGEGACSKPAEAVAVAAESCATACSETVEAVAVANEGEACSKPAEAVAVAAESCATACSETVEAVAVANEGEACSKPAEATAVAHEGATCSKPAEAVAVANNGEACATACSETVEAVAVANEGEACAATCSETVEAVAVATEACATECAEGVQAIAVGDKDAHAMPAALFAPINNECPGSGMPVKDGMTTVVSGFTVGFCCADCKAGFEGKSEAKQAAYVAKQVKTTINTECPGSGMPVAEGKVALYNGFAVGFCCESCQANWNNSDDAKKVAYIAKHHAAENEACPGSGNPINAEVVALYRGHTVGFCCEGCQGKFNKMNDDEKVAIVAGFSMGAETAASCEGCETGDCDGGCKTDA